MQEYVEQTVPDGMFLQQWLNEIPSHAFDEHITNHEIQHLNISTLKVPDATVTESAHTSIDKDGNKYIGKLKNGYYHGNGVLYNANGDSHVGEWENGRKNGNGKSEYIGGISIKGKWENGILLKGKLVDKYEIQTYLGSFKDNLKNGFGTEESNGDNGNYFYIGDFEDNVRQGPGKMYYRDSGAYSIGNFYKGKISGFGYLEFSDLSYIGYFEEHKKNGFGFRLSTKCGKKYKEYGYWKDDILIKSVGEEYYLINYKEKFQKLLYNISNIIFEKESKYNSSNIESEFGD